MNMDQQTFELFKAMVLSLQVQVAALENKIFYLMLGIISNLVITGGVLLKVILNGRKDFKS